MAHSRTGRTDVRLTIEIPATWSRSPDRRPGEEEVSILGNGLAPDTRIMWGPLILLPDEQRAWIDAAIRRDIPDGAEVQIVSENVGETTTGWPVRMVEVTVHPAARAPANEWRLVAFYAFFEHAAIAWSRASDEARYRAHRDTIRAVLLGATPDWSGEPACLTELWDVVTRSAPRQSLDPQRALVSPRGASPPETSAAVRDRLAELELAASPSPGHHVARAYLLRRLGEHDAEMAAFRSALALDASYGDAHDGLAAALAESGHHRDAIAAWEAAAAADLTNADPLFNAGIAWFRLGDYARALAAWQRALERAPREFWITRKLIQAHHALGQLEAAARARAALLEIWETSPDPAVRMQDEYVFAQVSVGEFVVHAFETLRPRDPSSYPLYTFRVVDAGPQTPPIRVALETSEYAKKRGAPYVLSVFDGTTYRAVGTYARLPPYGELEKTVVTLIEAALARRSVTR
jgi:tetratricopeptide (TPR) repeat protein